MATLYAQPTKEWVIPAKPKPGRKPKRDEPVADEEDGSDCKAKKVQNRAAQRAFRERKQSQLADLQARLTQYEQGEIERNVALQNVAKKLKEENERLKSDNEKLREEGDRVREENMSMRTRLRELQEEFSAYRRSVDPSSSHIEAQNFISTRKRSRAESTAPLNVITRTASPSPAPTDRPGAKRRRGSDNTRATTPALNTRASTAMSRRASNKGYSTLPPDYAPPPQIALAYSPASSDMSSRPSLIMSPEASESSSGAGPASFDDISPDADTAMNGFDPDKLPAPEFVATTTNESNRLHLDDCGFCSKDSDECVCREISIGLNQLMDANPSGPSTSATLNNTAGPETSSSSGTNPKPSILDNLPPVQPAIPLRLRRSKPSNASTSTTVIEGGPVHLTPVPQLVQLQSPPQPESDTRAKPVCSGDPSNCAACANDPFGKAFCMALASGGVCRDKNCMRCPKSDSQSPSASSSQIQPKSEDLGSAEKDKVKGKAGPMDGEIGSSSGVMGIGVGMGMGMGMSMESGMLLCCGDPKLCGGGGCGARAPPSPVKLPREPQRPSLQSSGSSELFIQTSSSMDGRDKDSVRLPPFSNGEGFSMVMDDDAELEEEEGGERDKRKDKDKDKEIPTNDAWARLKAHPNIAFADLALLADVVARRTKCTGTRVLLSPTPERDVDIERVQSQSDEGEGEEMDEQAAGASAMHPHPTLVPHEALVRCGRERLMRVQAEGVRDALAMLDVQRPN